MPGPNGVATRVIVDVLMLSDNMNDTSFRVLSFIVQFTSEHMTQRNNLREKSQVSLSGSALLRPLQLVLSLLLIPLTL